MLPRTTQQSYSAALGRESQIEPWLALGQPTACRRKSSHEPAPQCSRKPIHAPPRNPAAAEGLDVRKNSSKYGGKVFSLDIPFYRTRRGSRRGSAVQAF